MNKMKRQLKQLQAVVTRLGDHVGRIRHETPSPTPPGRSADRPWEPDVLTPRETIVHRLRAVDDGRIKQQALVDELDWSESTVSRHLSDLEADGIIERYQIGRENVVFLDGTDVSPFGNDAN